MMGRKGPMVGDCLEVELRMKTPDHLNDHLDDYLQRLLIMEY